MGHARKRRCNGFIPMRRRYHLLGSYVHGWQCRCCRPPLSLDPSRLNKCPWVGWEFQESCCAKCPVTSCRREKQRELQPSPAQYVPPKVSQPHQRNIQTRATLLPRLVLGPSSSASILPSFFFVALDLGPLRGGMPRACCYFLPKCEPWQPSCQTK